MLSEKTHGTAATEEKEEAPEENLLPAHEVHTHQQRQEHQPQISNVQGNLSLNASTKSSTELENFLGPISIFF